ncbi:MAG TPA: nucleoside diphosphate kinase regulator [Candidatus Marinimicrobia bacterium]|nr:nucleoside diphosphate kinase regulator [Candidatus Neomarinimicrobiota bacterium]HPY01194.1 nucleoside diphosphate kinase regulator [Candidatus Neomarinimicrobiota bacterium]
MTKEREIYITSQDLKRLKKELSMAGVSYSHGRDDLQLLAKELDRAKIIEASEIPEKIVTMNTRLIFRDLDDDSTMEVTIVFPIDANINKGKISVFSPIGTALLGYSEGDIIEWKVPAGITRIRIEKVLYQPEASGEFNL